MAKSHQYTHSRTTDTCSFCGHPRGHSNHGGEMDDGGWPIFDEKTLVRSIRAWSIYANADPDDVPLDRLPDIEAHIVNRAFELNLERHLPLELIDRAFAQFVVATLEPRLNTILEIAREYAQLARETGSSSDGGAG